MARPRDPTALKVAKGRSNLTKREVAEGLEREVYAADGEVAPPKWLKGEARRHFVKKAGYMAAVNRLAGANVYGSVDVEPLALMSVSYQRSREYQKEEDDARAAGDARAVDSAQGKRMREDRSYREFMKLLKLDPGSRVSVAADGGDDHGDDELSDV